jgi:hypothetical protein
VGLLGTLAVAAMIVGHIFGTLIERRKVRSPGAMDGRRHLAVSVRHLPRARHSKIDTFLRRHQVWNGHPKSIQLHRPTVPVIAA